MKRLSNILFTNLSKQQLKAITTIVDETIAPVIILQEPEKVFSAADLWSVHRQRRSFSKRRFIG